MQCGHCNEPITDTHYTYQWFSTDKLMKPVHDYHLKVKKGKTDGEPKPADAA